MKLKALVHNTDYALLQKQKAVLIDILNGSSLSPDKDVAIEGIINFLDSFQDAVVDDQLKTETEVFDHSIETI